MEIDGGGVLFSGLLGHEQTEEGIEEELQELQELEEQRQYFEWLEWFDPYLPEIGEMTSLDFWKDVDIRGPDDCWNWKGSVYQPSGYGLFEAADYGCSAHRLAWEIANREERGDLQVCHTCDNKLCCNPKHLVRQTRAELGRDLAIRGRMPSKISNEQVTELRQRYAAGGVTQRELAEEYGVTQGTISQIIRRASRRHVA